MARSTVSRDGQTLECEVEQVEVTSNLPYPDEGWAYVDAAGHEHNYGPGYPTLRWVVDETYWCEDCRDEHTEGHYECPLCGEHIQPGMRGPDLFRRYISGARSWYLDGQPVSEDDAMSLLEQWRSDA